MKNEPRSHTQWDIYPNTPFCDPIRIHHLPATPGIKKLLQVIESHLLKRQTIPFIRKSPQLTPFPLKCTISDTRYQQGYNKMEHEYHGPAHGKPHQTPTSSTQTHQSSTGKTSGTQDGTTTARRELAQTHKTSQENRRCHWPTPYTNTTTYQRLVHNRDFCLHVPAKQFEAKIYQGHIDNINEFVNKTLVGMTSEYPAIQELIDELTNAAVDVRARHTV